MAEFGENIRRAREDMGITQQTLADKLYVTRQAVSRWENGSRYPDLLTAKRLAATLDTNLDDLLAEDDMRTYPEVNPVIEYPLYKRIQTALFSAAFMVHLVQLIWYIGFTVIDFRFMLSWERTGQISSIIASAVITGTLLYGAVKSARDSVTPRVAAMIATIIIGTDVLNQLVIQCMEWRNHPASSVSIGFFVYLIFNITFIVLVLVFFLSEKPRSPIPVYIAAGFDMVMFIASYTINLISTVGTAQITKFMMTSSLRIFAVLLIPALFIYMTAVLYRKRRLAKA